MLFRMQGGQFEVGNLEFQSVVVEFLQSKLYSLFKDRSYLSFTGKIIENGLKQQHKKKLFKQVKDYVFQTE